MDQYCNGYHRAYDMSDTDGAAIPSIADGVVGDGTRDNGTFGAQALIVYEQLGVQVIYGHLQRPVPVKVGDKVKQGDTIGYQGSTNNQGVNMNSHLHIQFQPIEAMNEFDFTCEGIDPLDIDVGGDNMSYVFEQLPQLVDMRGKLTENSRWAAPKHQTSIQNLERAVHHSATHSTAAGSTTEAFARFHVNSHDWPCIGYKFSIEPHNIIDTPNGPRAVVHFNHDLNIVGYHVGNSNDLAMGILIAGNYLEESLTDAAMATFADLNNALDEDNIAMGGMFPHSAYPGYAWKQCSVYSPSYALNTGEEIVGGSTQIEVGDGKDESVPEKYTVQQGDTLYSIAATEEFTADDLMSWNNISNPAGLQVGQLLNLKKPSSDSTQKIKYDGDWRYNSATGVYWVPVEATFVVGSEPIYVYDNAPKIIPSNRAPSMAQPGAEIEVLELDRYGDYEWINYRTGSGSLRYMPIKEWSGYSGRLDLSHDMWGEFI